MSADPYRPVALAIVPPPARVEAAACQWCRWAAGSTGLLKCEHPFHQSRIGDKWVEHFNPRGECPHFSPSWLTRWMRRLGLGRAPAMVDPRVWEQTP
jgi:hypothetical protein